MLYLVLFTVILITRAVIPASVGCGNNPADIVFVLDASSSIWPPHFELMLDFVKKFANDFEVGPNKLQLGVVTYSNNVNKEFDMNQYGDSESLSSAILKVRQTRGRTNTAAGIRFMTNKMFTYDKGMRDGVPHIAIVITDGVSNNKVQTKQAAQEARDSGLMVVAIGVGRSVNKQELQNIAGPEGSVFEVSNFEALNSIRALIAIKVCKTACGEKHPADVVFLIDSYKSGDSNTKKALTFLGDLATQFEIADDKIHVGLVHNCLLSGWPLSKYSDKESLAHDVNAVIPTKFADLIESMTLRSFTVAQGARPEAKRIAVAIIDTKFPDKARTIETADQAKDQNVEIFVIGIGDGADYHELTLVASSPADKHVFSIEKYDDLPDLVSKIKINICKDL